jgi:hypothetical protein
MPDEGFSSVAILPSRNRFAEKARKAPAALLVGFMNRRMRNRTSGGVGDEQHMEASRLRRQRPGP